MFEKLEKLWQTVSDNITAGNEAEAAGSLETARCAFDQALRDCRAAITVIESLLNRGRADAAHLTVRLAAIAEKQGNDAAEDPAAGEKVGGQVQRQWYSWPAGAWPPRL